MVTAFVFISAKNGKAREVAEELKKIGNVKETHAVYGDYDVLSKVEAENLDGLNEFLIDTLRGVPNVAATNTLISL